ncbi:three-helix bundle dimerization domain-containing protein [Arthrobacter sp. 754]|uniref:three-helix bundle dimerization domain-containing protein n=1 Tax=Arthrobacter sp. 754 TaxID=3156315 RepID=UPI003391F26A
MGVCEELRALTVVVDRLAEKFPEVRRDIIEEVVQQQHRALDAGKVRDFVPVLVEHAARERLTQ